MRVLLLSWFVCVRVCVCKSSVCKSSVCAFTAPITGFAQLAFWLCHLCYLLVKIMWVHLF